MFTFMSICTSSARPKYLTLQQPCRLFSMLIYLFMDVYWLCYDLYCCCRVVATATIDIFEMHLHEVFWGANLNIWNAPQRRCTPPWGKGTFATFLWQNVRVFHPNLANMLGALLRICVNIFFCLNSAKCWFCSLGGKSDFQTWIRQTII